jgi:hypothetical protein
MDQVDESSDFGGFTVAEFCARYKISKTGFYREIAEKKLRAKKVRGRTIILFDAARAWARSLPDAA